MRFAAGQTDTTFIPPYLVDADPSLGEIACDTCYTRLDSADPLDDLVPDIPIGRLPVRTVEEAATVIAKTVTALTAPPSGSWQQQAIILADNDHEADGTPDKAGGFVQMAETDRALLPASWQATRVYYAPDHTTAAPFYTDALTTRCAFFRALDGSTSDRRCPTSITSAPTTNGAALLLYVGHASPWQWATTELDGDPPYLYNLYDADRLINGGRLPISLVMSCLSGAFANPDLVTIDERLLVHGGGGDVASLSSSGLVIDAGQAAITKGLLPVLLQRGGMLGAAHLAGLRSLADAGVGTALAYSFNVLGDPEIMLPQVQRGTAYLPVVTR